MGGAFRCAGGVVGGLEEWRGVSGSGGEVSVFFLFFIFGVEVSGWCFERE